MLAAVRLLAAELLGYAGAILVLILVIGPVLAAQPAFGWALRIAAALYLAYLAVQLWGHRLDEYVGKAEVYFRQVLVATLLNPKSLVFAFVLLPAPAPDGRVPLLHLAALALLIPLCGAGWVLLGAQVGRSAGEDVRLSTLRRIGAAVLALFAVLMPAQAIWS